MKARAILLLSAATSFGGMCAAGQTVAAAAHTAGSSSVTPTNAVTTPAAAHAPDPPTVAPAAAVPPAPAPPSTGEDLRKRVAIDAFDYSAVIPEAQLIFNPELEKKKKVTITPVVPNIGAGIRAILIQRLSEAGKVVIVDKDKLDEIKKMQEDALSNRNQPGKGPGAGRIRAPDLLLAGDVVVFGRDDKRLGIGAGGGVSRVLCPLCGAIGSFRKEEDKAVVKVTYKIIDGETGEVIKSGDANGESIRKSKSFGGMAVGNGKGGGIALDMGSANFAQTIIGEATQDCIKNLADILNDQLGKMKHRVHEVQGKVAKVSGNTVTLNVGSNDGVNIGDVFEVLKEVGEVDDPVTHEVLHRDTEKKGEMTVAGTFDRIASGTYAGAPVEPGDIAHRTVAAGDQK
jgi:curli biogenesis system outer membrane secretion channel CsgG